MGQYNIDQFSTITGVTKFLLRTWENRYDYLKAERTKTNVRIYNDQMVVRALNTNYLIKSGYKISKISKLSDSDMFQIIEELQLQGLKKSDDLYIKSLIISAINLDNYLFDSTYESGVEELGFIEFYKRIVLVVLNRIGVFWLSNRVSPSQEHIFTSNLKRKILSRVDSFKYSNTEKANWLLFLPENELHDIGLLFAYALLSESKFPVIYLGANLPSYSLKDVKEKFDIDNILVFSMCNKSSTTTMDTLKYIENNFKNSNSYLVNNCKDSSLFKIFKTVNIITDVDEFIKLIH